MLSKSAGVPKRNDQNQLGRTGNRNSSNPCSTCIEERKCSATTATERLAKHENLEQYRKAA